MNWDVTPPTFEIYPVRGEPVPVIFSAGPLFMTAQRLNRGAASNGLPKGHVENHHDRETGH